MNELAALQMTNERLERQETREKRRTYPKQSLGCHPADGQRPPAVNVEIIACEQRPVDGHVGDFHGESLAHQAVAELLHLIGWLFSKKKKERQIGNWD